MSDADRTSELHSEPCPECGNTPHLRSAAGVGDNGHKLSCSQHGSWERRSVTTTGAPEGANEPPPVEGEVLRWQSVHGAVWQSVVLSGRHALWIDGAWVEARSSEALRRLAEALAAERAARAAQVEDAYLEGFVSGCEQRSKANKGQAYCVGVETWAASRACAALGEGAK